MHGRLHRFSLFAQSFDRTAFISYFLGAVIPLGALAYLSHRFILPQLSDNLTAMGMVALLVSMAVLSFGSFMALRRSAAQALLRMTEDNRRLASLLVASKSVVSAPHRAAAAQTLAACAHSLAGDGAALLLAWDEKAQSFDVLGQAGEAATLEVLRRESPDERVRIALEQGLPVVDAVQNSEGPSTVAVVPIVGSSGSSGAIVVQRFGHSEVFDASWLDALSMLAGLAGVALRNSELQDVQRNFFVHVTDLLLIALETHLGDRAGDSRRVARISNRVGRKLELDEERLEPLHFAALLHDLGMLKLDGDQLGNKKAQQMHPGLGAKMLSPIRVWEKIAPIVLHHHEWYDGQGYPERIAGEDIPLESRIVAVAEAVDSMLTPKSYKEALPLEEVLRRVREGSGTQFDPRVVDALLELVEQGDMELEASR